MTNQQFWPGTKIVKSFDNAFNWRQGTSWVSRALRTSELKSISGTLGGQVARKIMAAKEPITAYSKARAK